jgi:hypothetical protein
MSVKLKAITHTFISGKLSTTVIIPINIARKYKIDKPANVIVEEADDGILIKPLHLEDSN